MALIAVRATRSGFRPLVARTARWQFLCGGQRNLCPRSDRRDGTSGDLEPGEVVVVRRGRLRSLRPFGRGGNAKHFCIFEYIYFARPDSNLAAHNVYAFRKELGRALAAGAPGVSGHRGPGARLGKRRQRWASPRKLGIPYETGDDPKSLRRAAPSSSPAQSIRDFGVKRQAQRRPAASRCEGKRVVLVDDSIVRGTTLRKISKMLRGAVRPPRSTCGSLPPDDRAVLLRDRHAHAGGADRLAVNGVHSGDPRPSWARTPWATCPSRACARCPRQGAQARHLRRLLLRRVPRRRSRRSPDVPQLSLFPVAEGRGRARVSERGRLDQGKLDRRGRSLVRGAHPHGDHRVSPTSTAGWWASAFHGALLPRGDRVSHGMHVCDYLLACDMEMDPTPGYAFTSWETGYGDLRAMPDLGTLRRAAWLDRAPRSSCAMPARDGRRAHRGGAAHDPEAPARAPPPGAGCHAFRWEASSSSSCSMRGLPIKAARARAITRALTTARRYVEDYHLLSSTSQSRGGRSAGTWTPRDPRRVQQGRVGTRPARNQSPLCARPRDGRPPRDLQARRQGDRGRRRTRRITFMAKWDSADHAGNSLQCSPVSLTDEAGISRPLRRRRRGTCRAPLSGASHEALPARFVERYARARACTCHWSVRSRTVELLQALPVEGTFAPTRHRVELRQPNRGLPRGRKGRVSSGRVPHSGRDANPYLVYAALLAAGLDGIERGLDPGPVYAGNVYEAEGLPQVPSSLARPSDCSMAVPSPARPLAIRESTIYSTSPGRRRLPSHLP